MYLTDNFSTFDNRDIANYAGGNRLTVLAATQFLSTVKTFEV